MPFRFFSCVHSFRSDSRNISFSAAVVGECRVAVRFDNVEMAPLKLVFVAPAEGGGGGKGKKPAVSAEDAAPITEVS